MPRIPESPGERQWPRLAIVAALEALEVGDQDYAVSILLGALEDGPTEQPYACPTCELTFRWPGELDHHQRFSHQSSQMTSALAEAA